MIYILRNKCREYKNNKHAMMKEVDHARLLNETIKKIDKLLKKYVDFS